MTKVSIIMPAFNAEEHIAQAIDSIIRQTFEDWELIVIDDGSTDGTWETITRFNEGRIRIYGIPHSGIVAALNKGLELSSGKYIARHDADDYSDHRRLDKQVELLDLGKNYDEADIVGSAMLLVDCKGYPFEIMHYPKLVTKDALWERCCIAHPTVMFRREVYEKIGGYDSEFNMNCCEDYDYWLRAVEHFKIFNMERVLYTKRVYDQSNIGRTTKKTIRAFDDLARVKARIRGLK